MHGSKDPVVPKKDRDSFEAEMEACGAKWQMTVFGGLLHSICKDDRRNDAVNQIAIKRQLVISLGARTAFLPNEASLVPRSATVEA